MMQGKAPCLTGELIKHLALIPQLPAVTSWQCTAHCFTMEMSVYCFVKVPGCLAPIRDGTSPRPSRTRKTQGRRRPAPSRAWQACRGRTLQSLWSPGPSGGGGGRSDGVSMHQAGWGQVCLPLGTPSAVARAHPKVNSITNLAAMRCGESSNAHAPPKNAKTPSRTRKAAARCRPAGNPAMLSMPPSCSAAVHDSKAAAGRTRLKPRLLSAAWTKKEMFQHEEGGVRVPPFRRKGSQLHMGRV